MKTNLSIKTIVHKSFMAFRYSLFQILWFEAVCKAASAIVVVPLLNGVMNLALRLGRRGFVANGEIVSFLFTPAGIVMAVLLFVLAVFFIYTEFSVLILLLYHGYRGEKVKASYALKQALASIKGLFTVRSLGFGVYTLVVLPLANLGIVSSLLPALAIPNFVVDSLSETVWGAVLLLSFSLLVVFVGVMLSYALPAMVLEHIPFQKAVAKSKVAFKKSALKRLLTETVFVAAWVVLLVVPIIILAAIIDVSGFLAPDMLDVFGTFGIVWRSIACLVAVAVIWALQALFVPMMLAVDTVTYLELDGSAVAVDGSLPRPQGAKRPVNRPRRIAAVLLTVLAIVFVSNAINTVIGVAAVYTNPVQPVIMGHRGSLEGVENTLEAIQGAIDAGADYAEIDVRLSGDGVPVVIHDAKLSRLAGQKLTVEDLTAAELAGIRLEQNGFTGEISTLAEVIQFARGRIKLNIELKPSGGNGEELVAAVAAVVEKEGFSQDCLFQSLSYAAVQSMKAAHPEYSVGYIVYGNLGLPTAVSLRHLGIDFLAVEESFATPRLVAACRKADIPVYVWTVNAAEDMRRFWEMGVDGLITGYPVLARQELVQI